MAAHLAFQLAVRFRTLVLPGIALKSTLLGNVVFFAVAVEFSSVTMLANSKSTNRSLATSPYAQMFDFTGALKALCYIQMFN